MGLSRQTIDLVVTDVKMPNMDGIKLAHKLKEQLPDLPIVLISGYADVSETLVRAQTLTFQFVAKPFRGDDLVNAVEKAAEQIRLSNNKVLPDDPAQASNEMMSN
jgi:DNA-binding NtrC family response regulator